MTNNQAVEFLYRRFGAKAFKVADLADEDLYELMDLMQLPMNPNDHGNRVNMGNKFMEAADGRWSFHASGKPFLIGIENRTDQHTGETGTYYLY